MIKCKLNIDHYYSKLRITKLLFQTFRCIGDLIAGHGKNLEALARKILGEQPHEESALNSVLRIVLRTSSVQEFLAADYIFKCFCEVVTVDYFLTELLPLILF